MSGVDVLAVMDSDRDAVLFANGDAADVHLHDEARAAVAELIEALTAERHIRYDGNKPPFDVEMAAYARTDIALRKVQP